MATITKNTVDGAQPTDRDTFIWDDAIPGFGLKVTPAGGKVYIYQYRMGGRSQPTRRKTIGKHGPLTPEQARKRAKELAALVTQGTDPIQIERDAMAAREAAKKEAAQRKQRDADLSFEKVAERWLADYETDNRPRSYAVAKSAIDKHLLPKLRGKPLPTITRADLQAIIDKIPAKKPALRRTVYAYASVLFGWAMQRDEIDENPVAKLARPKTAKARERVLADDELKAIWKATGAIRAPLGAFYRVLLLTGQRREEVAGMLWSELDRDNAVWTIPGDRAKNDKTHIVPLAPAVIAELDGRADGEEWPESGPVMSIRGNVPLSCYSQAKTLLDAAVTKANKGNALAAWRVHDLRRTVATGFQKLGVRFEVTEAVLNHVSGARGGVAGIYQRHDWADEKRSALNAWATHVQRLVTGHTANNVVQMTGVA